MKLRITRPLFQGAQMLAPGVIVDVPVSVGETFLRQKAAIVLEEDKQVTPPLTAPEHIAAKPERSRKKHAQAEPDR